MSNRRTPAKLAAADLTRLCESVVTLGRKYVSSLPNGEAGLSSLSALTAAFQAADTARVTDVRERKEAVDARDALHTDARKLYAEGRKWALLAKRRAEGGAELTALLESCTGARRFLVTRLIGKMEELAAGADIYAAQLASVSMDPGLPAQIRAKAQELRAAVDAVSAAEADEQGASNRCHEARAALLAQLDLVEEQMELRLPGDGLDGLKSIRDRYLPRYASKSTAA